MINRNSTDSAPRKAQPHHRLTIADVIRDYEAGLLTAKGAIFYFVSASLPPGKPVRMRPHEFCRKLQISKSTYYLSLAQLESDSRLKIDESSEIVLSVPVSTTTGIPDYIFLGELSDFSDSQSEKSDSQSEKSDSQSEKSDSQSEKSDNQPLEHLLSGVSESLQLDQLDQLDQLTTKAVSPTPPPVFNWVKESGIELTESQLEQLEDFSNEQIKNAIAVVQGSKRVEDKVRLFFSALRNGWRSKLPRESGENFKEWFERAREKGQVIASMKGEDGVIQVLMADHRWQPLADAILEISGL